ncbi:nucleoside triphosphate pyrophosphohydrolase [Desertibacillus haloalkaliphilus]|uniref:nucleoside triphosphate pyrophosphohydrolase n=1 Tax=Desertibacillus haloalkaliphilus TaxID=1328930 RepID=UPI001C27CF64|nr:nucleoside triphosphate pyrophosphohydrolase [Desertibacillus haloalkaliphilus]MBU8907675.1 nucleoside triphosphate pyrophosphohydrolase [Desertibacillus haloalkaliphilus]
MPLYNKLVRDKIPEVIEEAGKLCRTRILDDNEYIKELQAKSREELEEYMSESDDKKAVEELADLLEVMHALAAVHGFSMAEIEKIRAEKAEKRGGFQDKVFLIDVEDD